MISRLMRLAGVLAAAWLLVAAAPAVAQNIEQVPVRASAEGARARLVFAWASEVEFETRLVGDTLEIRFARRLIPSFAEVFTNLAGFVESAGLGGNGHVVTLKLTGPLEVSSTREGTAVVIDLARTVPPEPELPTVPVRFGEHESFSRVVFDWTREVGYRLERANGRVVIRFDRPAAVDLSAAERGLPPLIDSVEATRDGPGLAVAIGVAERARLRHYRVGLKVVVDVYATEPEPEPVQAAEATDPEPTATAAAEAPAAATTAPAVRGAGNEPRPSGWATARARALALARTGVALADAGSVDGERGDGRTTATTEGEEETAAAGPPQGEAGGAGRHTTRRWKRQRAETVEAPEDAAGESEASRGEGGAEQAPPAAPAGEPAVAAAGEDSLLVSFDTVANGLELHFDWPVPVAAAVFERAGHVWVVFDSPATFNFRLFRDDVPVVESAEQVAMAGAAVARFRLSGRYRPKVRLDGRRWIVRLGPSGGPSEPLQVVAEPDSEVGARLLVVVEEAGGEFTLVDPEVGDQLFVVPVAAAGRGIAPARRLVDLEMLATAQGVVVRPIADTIAVRTLREGIEVTNLAGLNLAGVPAEGEEGAASVMAGAVVRGGSAMLPEAIETALFVDDEMPVFDFAAWRGRAGGGFPASKSRLNLELARSEPEQRGDARLALARFHFAHGQAAEALGWIGHAVAMAPWLDQDPALRALRGAANLLQGRFSEARADLFDPDFDLSREMRLWRGVWLAENGDMATAHQAFLVAGPLPDDYPPGLSVRFALLAAEAAARAGDVERAHTGLDELHVLRPGRGVLDAIAYVRGVAFAHANRVDEALEDFARAAGSDNRLIRAKAERDRIELRLAEGLADTAEAIDGYDRLRFVWRGDSFELDLLQRMAELYIADGDYGNGLAIYRRAISVFPDSPDVRVIANIMNDTYKNLFLGDGAEELTALEALAIYFDFRELTPVGAIGDQMILSLADRLVEVDLLGQAAAVLQHQVDYRLRGNELAKVGVRLARIYLLDQKAEAAVRALRASAVPGMPDELARQRRDLTVRALTEIGEHDQALDLLQGDAGPEADRLRADIYWRQEDWLAAATVTARVLSQRSPADELSAGERDELMRMAVALALTNNRAALAKLRERYGGVLERSERAQAFRAIASYVDAGPVNPLEIAEAAAEIDSYDAFLASLRSVEGSAQPRPENQPVVP